ncbi:MAG: hypothetical protein ACXW1W_08835 [Methylococcaceae bacterium]
MTNMEKFNKCAAEIFSLLYDKFPVVTDIDIDNFPEYDNQEDREVFDGTIDFLNREGFINYRESTYGAAYFGVLLTLKGLTVLNSTPKAISDKSTLGDKVKDVLKTGQNEGIKAIIDEIMKFALEILPNSI